MALLYRTGTIDRLWVILEAYAPFTALVLQTRRVKDTEEGWLRRIMLRAPGDFPIVQIDMGDRFTGGMPKAETFAAENATFGGTAGDYWIEERTAEFKVSFIYEKPGFDKQDELEMTFIEALEESGRSLGYDGIVNWGPWKGNRSGTALVNDIARPVTQIVFPVTYEFTGTELKPTASS